LTEKGTEPITVVAETMIVAWAALLAGLLSVGYCLRHGLLLLYGDAVAHLYIGRRIVDSMNPGLNQLGSVWLPLPHLLLSPFVQNDFWWRTGLAGIFVSLPCYVLGCAGIYRLARLWLPLPGAVVGAAFYGLNPGLLYLATTAMTEPLFLAEMIWAAVLIVQLQRTLDSQIKEGGQLSAAGRRKRKAALAAAGEEPPISVRRQLLRLGWLLVAAVFTRYDGWIYAAVAWFIVTLSLWVTRRSPQRHVIAWTIFTLLLVAAPTTWMAYNARQFGDPLDFLRGSYSARAIEARTSAGGSASHPGTNSPRVAALYFLKAAEMGAVPLRGANILLWWTIAGTVLAAYRFRRREIWPALLLWLPLPFYAYSIAYGAVPLFIPIWTPYSWYNTRYGMELLPAFALFGAFLVAALLPLAKKYERWMPALPLLLIVLNAVVLVREGPLVFREAEANSRTRVPFERALANALLQLPDRVPILMYTAQNIGAVQITGMPLKRFINEGDYYGWRRALVNPAQAAPFAIALDGDPVSQAIREHPADMSAINVICSTGQPCARIYHSQKFASP
jgi:hypothetical protein